MLATLENPVTLAGVKTLGPVVSLGQETDFNDMAIGQFIVSM